MILLSLDPRHFAAIDDERRLRQPASRYEQLDPDQVITEWRLSHHIVSADTAVTEAYRQIPTTMHQLRFLYQMLLTLPATTASVERGFSKLNLLKSKLRSAMNQDRLESLLLASIEKDLSTASNTGQGLGSSIRKHSRSTNASCLMELKKS